jgi:hypothetical protein
MAAETRKKIKCNPFPGIFIRPPDPPEELRQPEFFRQKFIRRFSGKHTLTGLCLSISECMFGAATRIAAVQGTAGMTPLSPDPVGVAGPKAVEFVQKLQFLNNSIASLP